MNFPNNSEMSEAKIRDTISMYGYSMRALIDVLQNGPAGLEGHIDMKAQQLSTVSLSSLTQLDCREVRTVYHSLVVGRRLDDPTPGTLAYFAGDVPRSAVASPAVWRKLVLHHGRKAYLDMTNLLDSFRKIPETASSAGWLWESLCHDRISKGGAFTLEEMVSTGEYLMPSGNTVPINILQRERHFYSSNDLSSSTSGFSHYFIPSAGNNPTFDAFLHHQSASIGLQMTLAKDHTLKPKGLRLLYKRLGEGPGENWFVFVIRKGTPFKTKKPSAIQMSRFKFFILELPLPSREYHFPSLAGVNADDLEFSGVDPKIFDKAVEMDGHGPLTSDDDSENEDEVSVVGTN